MGTSRCIDIHPFPKADKFLSFLRRTNPFWGEDIDIPWVFRGQWNHEWPLMPKAWREEGKAILKPIIDKAKPLLQEIGWLWIEADRKDAEEGKSKTRDIKLRKKELLVKSILQMGAEYEIVQEFISLADELGFPIGFADDLGILRINLFARNPYAGRWPEYKSHPAFGFAQHFGIPTRMLDWTGNPLVAAYFAVEPKARKGAPEKIAVWALNLQRIESTKDTGLWDSPEVYIKTVYVPRYQNSFLHAQSGMFIHISDGEKFYTKNDKHLPLEDAFELIHAEEAPPPLIKLTLPSDEADNLLKLLWREKVSGAHLMPNYENITNSIMTKLSFYSI